MPRAHQIYEQTNRARHSRRQLPEKCVAGIDVSAFAIFRLDHSALLVGFTRIVAGEQRLEMVIPGVHEVKATLLHPAVKIFLRKLIRMMKNWILGVENGYGRFFDGYARSA